MLRWLFLVPVALTFILVTGCSSGSGVLNEASFYGIWSRNTNPGDTLYFFRQGTKNMMRYNASYNPRLPVYNETEFAYKNERLCIANPYAMTQMSNPVPLEGFTWVTPGRTFTATVNQIYLFLSAYPSNGTYTKIK